MRLADELDIRLIPTGAAEAWMVAGELAAANVPVVIDPMQNLPGFQCLDVTLENAASLHTAGVTVAFATFTAHNSRTLRQLAGNAVAYGMPHDAALAAVTGRAGARLGDPGPPRRDRARQTGRTRGVVERPAEVPTRAEHVLIRGREVPAATRQRLLFERYRSLPIR